MGLEKFNSIHSYDKNFELYEAVNYPIFVWEIIANDFKLCFKNKASKIISFEGESLKIGFSVIENYGETSLFYKKLKETADSKKFSNFWEWNYIFTDSIYGINSAFIEPNFVVLTCIQDSQINSLNQHFSDKYQALLEHISDSVLLLDKDFKIIYRSLAYLSEISKDLSYLNNNTILDLVHPDFKNYAVNILKEVSLNPVNPIDFKAKVMSASGTYIWVEGMIKNMLHYPNVEAILLNYRDVTSRIDAEKELLEAKQKIEESEARLAEAQFATHVGSWETNLHTFDVIWSKETYHIFELDSSTFIASHNAFLSFVHKEDKERVDEAFHNSILSSGYHSIEHRIITSKGNLRYVEERWRIEFNEFGKPIKAVGTCQDITERKRIENDLVQAKIRAEEFAKQLIMAGEVLQEQENKYRTLFETSNDAILLYTDGVWIDCNKSALRLFGCHEQEILFQSPIQFSPRLQLDGSLSEKKAKEKIELTLAGKPQVFEWLHCRINGEVFFAEVNLNLLELNGKQHIQAIIRDISDRKLLEIENAKIISDLIQKNRELEQFSYIVSHNLRAPVANIMGISEYMLSDNFEVEENLKLLEGLNKSSNALDSVIRDLNFILQRKQEINEQTVLVDFEEIVSNIRHSIAHLIEKENVLIETDFLELRGITTVKSYLYSIFYNLITNSIKYRQRGMQPRVLIKSMLNNDKAVLTFKDNGLGIDIAKKGDQLFMLYKRFHYHTEGKGMGLFMVKSQVESLGGRISVKSEVNVGTEFEIQFNH